MMNQYEKMKTIKCFTVFILVLCLCQFAGAEKRKARKPMKEFTDPSSPSYVPHPYPKNRQEIIEDLKYAINKLFVEKGGTFIDGKVPEVRKHMVQIVEKDSIYKIGEIIKVNNRNHRMPDDYTWLIIIRNQKGEITSRVSLMATGLLGGAILTKYGAKYCREKYPNSRRGPQYLKTNEDAINLLSKDLGKPVEKHEIKKIERVGFQSILGGLRLPMFEIKMTSGKIYYYSVKTEEVYEIEERKHWERDKNGYRVPPYQLAPKGKKHVYDSINEEVLVLKALKERDTVYIYK